MLRLTCALSAFVSVVLGTSTNIFSSRSISIVSVDGQHEIILDGKRINLNDAKVLDENQTYTWLSPVEVEGAVVRINKLTQEVAVDYKGAHYETQSSEKVLKETSRQISESMRKMNQNVRKLQEDMEKMQKAFSNPSFFKWSPVFTF